MDQMSLLCCPVCKAALTVGEKTAVCRNGHSFDRAREGYYNLLISGKSGDKTGDSKASARSRRDFLSKGYYSVLKDTLTELFSKRSGTVLDICCGEGYYTAALGENPALSVYGFDLSKEMIRLAAKRGNARYFVANLAAIPVADASFDAAVHLFAPFHEPEFARVLKPGGQLYTVVPGKKHLWELKEALYDAPYENDEKLPETSALMLQGTRNVQARIHLSCREDIEAVFQMTPYYYHTGEKDRAKLLALDTLDTEISFVIAEYTKK